MRFSAKVNKSLLNGLRPMDGTQAFLPPCGVQDEDFIRINFTPGE